jgi:hypothetical protein
VLQAIHNLQRRFLWQGNHAKRKWDLVSWDNICRPKLKGGLGLRDPCTLNEIMGAKIWWRWLKHPKELWARLWKQKYAPNCAEVNLIRMNDWIHGSNIWNATWRNMPLIQEHAFWEIRNGQATLFWTNSWKQLPPLVSLDNLQPIYALMQGRGDLQVENLWKAEPTTSHWRDWKVMHRDLELSEECNLRPWKEAIS